jgi:hypothetical protein
VLLLRDPAFCLGSDGGLESEGGLPLSRARGNMVRQLSQRHLLKVSLAVLPTLAHCCHPTSSKLLADSESYP